MSNNRQKQKAVKDLSFYFAEKGKFLSQKEYIDAEDKPIAFSHIRRIFRSYSRLLEMLKKQQPELIDMVEKKVAPKPAPAPAAPKPAPVAPSQPKPVASVKPAVKPAVKVDKDDE